jgi:UDP-N-acetyl-D-glucosamine dehydrogenase
VQRRTRIAVLGLGYVGLPLAVECAEEGFHIVGVDLDACKVAALNCGHSSSATPQLVGDVPSTRVAPLAQSGRLCATTDYAAVDRVPDVVFIHVPTPDTGAKMADLSTMEAATEALAAHPGPEPILT